MPSRSSSKKAPETKSSNGAKVVHNNYVQIDFLKNKELKDYFQYLSSPQRVFWMNFLAGTARGLGFILGTVVVVAIVSFIIGQVLSEIPWIGELFRWLEVWLQENLESYS